jgi:hypothetical protein
MKLDDFFIFFSLYCLLLAEITALDINLGCRLV